MNLWRKGKRGSRWALWERFEVPCLSKPLEPHFVRYRIVGTPWVSFYVHKFVNADERTHHDHPWSFFAVQVWPPKGGYEEAMGTLVQGDASILTAPAADYLATSYRFRRWLSVNVKRATDLHYVNRLLRSPTWTVIVVGRRVRTWGYVDHEGGWTAFNEHPYADVWERREQALRQAPQQARP